jgi:hypothetical protein
MIGAVAVIASLAAEALAVYVFAELIAVGYDGNEGAVSAFSFILIALAAYGLPRFVGNFRVSSGATRAISAAATFLVIYGVMRLEFAGDLSIWNFGWIRDFATAAEATARDGAHAIMGSLLIVGLWIRSSIRSDNDIDLELVPRTMGWTFLLATGVILVGAASERSGEIARGGAAFYAVAILGLACSQLARSGATIGDVRAGGITATLLAGTAAVTAVCVILFWLIFGLFADPLGTALSAIIQTTLTIVLTPFAWILSKVFGALLGNLEFVEPTQEVITQIGGEQPEEGERSLFDRLVLYAFRTLGLLLVIAIVAGAIALAMSLRRRLRPSADRINDAGEVSSIPLDPRSLWRSLRGPRSHTERPGAGTGIYRLYRDVLEDARHRGRERRIAETPEEFAPSLVETFHAPVTDEITLAFEEARYAGREPDARLVEDLEKRWRSSH